jgi:mono/diheme cytochrome c family protein
VLTSSARALAAGVCRYLPAPLAAAADPDPAVESGKAIAQRVCPACHVVGPDDWHRPSLEPPARSFVELANWPGTTLAGPQRYAKSAHRGEKTLPAKMPNLMLLDTQAVAVARYIMALRRS